jgi:hypothetical protein
LFTFFFTASTTAFGQFHREADRLVGAVQVAEGHRRLAVGERDLAGLGDLGSVSAACAPVAVKSTAAAMDAIKTESFIRAFIRLD